MGQSKKATKANKEEAANKNAAPAEARTLVEIDHMAYGYAFKAKLSATFNALEEAAAHEQIIGLKGKDLFNALVQFNGISPIEASHSHFGKPIDIDESTAATRKWDHKGRLAFSQSAGHAPVTDKKALKEIENTSSVRQFERNLFGGALKLAA